MDFLTRIIARKKQDVARAAAENPPAALQRIAAARRDQRPFFKALKQPGKTGVNIIAEIKRASPSKGPICPDLDPVHLAVQYERGGAGALSVLTDGPFFNARPGDLQAARNATRLPVLRKDFMVTSYQIYESAAMGADAVLLIVRVLSARQLEDYLDLCRALAIDALVEIHSPADLEKASAAGAQLIGINNRNLTNFATDIGNAVELVSHLVPGQVPVAASGIGSPLDIRTNLDAGIFNFLIGESLVRAADPAAFIKTLSAAGCRRTPPENET